MRIRLGIVSETNERYLNQVKLCLFSLRKNAGALSQVPVTLITNSTSLDADEEKFFIKHFSPIEFKTMPRLGAIRHTSKLNVFYAIEPSSYDVLIYLDCDTVIVKSLDSMLDPIIKENAQFVCRRGGQTDRDRFVDFDTLVKKLCGQHCKNKILFEEKEEWPMFNTGVFLATSEAVCKIRKNSVEFTYLIFNEWQKVNAIENLPFTKFLHQLKIFKSKQQVLESWPIEQGAIALSCIKSGVKVQYLDEIYNTWGDQENLRILHCFKSAYGFDRSSMYSESSKNWISRYLKSGLPGKIFLANIVNEFKETFIKTNS